MQLLFIAYAMHLKAYAKLVETCGDSGLLRVCAPFFQSMHIMKQPRQ